VKQNAPHILFINPWIHDFAAYDFWAKPMGLLILAAILRAHGVSVSYIDCLDRFHPRARKGDPAARYGRGPYLKTEIPKPLMIPDVPRKFSRYGIKPEWFKESLSTVSRPDFICLTSMMTYWYPGVQETISHIRDIYPETPIVLGGIYASLCKDHALSESGADRIVTGPGETAILDLVSEMTGFSVSPRFAPDRLDTYPYPAFDLQNRIAYAPLMTSRGCPFSCAYCASRFLSPRRMLRTSESVLEEVLFWHKSHGVIDFALYDDAFLVDAERHAVPILEDIIKSGMRLRFHTPNALHIRSVTRDTAQLMFKAGFTSLRLGLETIEFSERSEIDRKVTAEEFRSAVSHLKDAGFKKDQVGAYLLAGLPGQSMQTLKKSVQIVKQSGITPIPAYYSPIPHTDLWEKALSASRYDLSADPVFTNNAIMPCRKEPFSWESISALKELVRF
jgi:radical SAM superfamily enzyme YgiQ (UPF0313 family)